MPRRARGISKTGVYHVMMRGVNRQCIFEGKQDYQKYIQVLKQVKEISDCELYAYCLMPNHVHLLLKPEGEDLGVVIKRIGCRYVHWYNKKYERVGHLFQDRYKSEPVEDEKYFLTVLRYIIQNPFKVNLEKEVGEYNWSSYNEYMVGSNGLTDISLACSIAGGKDNLINFIKQANKDDAIENNDDVVKPQTRELKEIFYKITGCARLSEFQTLPDYKQKIYIGRLFDNNLSLSQIAKITGKPKSTVHRIVEKG